LEATAELMELRAKKAALKASGHRTDGLGLQGAGLAD
jgi:hypothetical protein